MAISILLSIFTQRLIEMLPFTRLGAIAFCHHRSLNSSPKIAIAQTPNPLYLKVFTLLESKEAIIPRPSLLDLDVHISMHPAPDILSLRFCSCGYNRGKIHV